jgi:hypothetical protein
MTRSRQQSYVSDHTILRRGFPVPKVGLEVNITFTIVKQKKIKF